MTLIFIVLPLALLITAGAIIGFIWAARSGQFDDVDTPAVRMLLDDVPPRRLKSSDKQDPAAQGARSTGSQ